MLNDTNWIHVVKSFFFFRMTWFDKKISIDEYFFLPINTNLKASICMIGKKVLQLKKKKKIVSYTIGLRTFKDQEETLVIFERYLNNT